MADTSTEPRLRGVDTELPRRAGLRVRPQRTARALFGLLLVAVCVVAVLVIYTRIGDRSEVLAVNRTVLAGEQLADADLRVVSISADESFASVPASARASLVGQYAKVRLVEGALLVTDSLQTRPLVDPSKVLMSVPVPLSGIPTGLREGSRLVLIVTQTSAVGESPPALIEATVAAVPRNLGELVSGGGESGGSPSTVALSVEVDPSAAVTIGPAEKVAVAVLAPDEPFPTATAAPAGETVTASSTPASTPAGGG
jgi:SAF domain